MRELAASIRPDAEHANKCMVHRIRCGFCAGLVNALMGSQAYERYTCKEDRDRMCREVL